MLAKNTLEEAVAAAAVEAEYVVPADVRNALVQAALNVCEEYYEAGYEAGWLLGSGIGDALENSE